MLAVARLFIYARLLKKDISCPVQRLACLKPMLGIKGLSINMLFCFAEKAIMDLAALKAKKPAICHQVYPQQAALCDYLHAERLALGWPYQQVWGHGSFLAFPRTHRRARDAAREAPNIILQLEVIPLQPRVIHLHSLDLVGDLIERGLE